ncbi:MAG: hypothetical protein KME25_27630 [Symplocastrum torsivum CPER-KK1]|uniref:Uncharacterized protein n=1 Tax=Symplocastrum torsivum CPER-KK1 TaxID=450513 RepID=A0A951PQR3_9CYAN|nr:hypothetical protein [Symplocastrum torsivum CPER-KK1]
MKDSSVVASPWTNPLPLEEFAATKVVIYSYDDRWVPITFSNLAEAIKIYHQALLHGAEIFVFPPDSTLDHSTIGLLSSL